MDTRIFTELLRLYSRKRKTLYLNYMEDFKYLVAWLKPVPPELPLPELPWYEQNYEVGELAKILGTTPQVIHKTLKELS